MKFSKVLFICSDCNRILTVFEQGGGHRTVNTYCSTCGRKYFVNLFLTNEFLKIEVNADVDFHNSPRILHIVENRPLSPKQKPHRVRLNPKKRSMHQNGI